tara:strand:+ start:1067 stop:1774 length:708 start_codon:yes stop_codon:yes gene_type:complete
VDLEKLKIDKPVLLIGSANSIEKFDGYQDYFTLSTGKSLYAIEKVNIVVSLDLIRIIHNISNFRKRWDYHLIPHCISHHLWGERQKETEILNPSPGVFLYTRRPAYSSMFFNLEDFHPLKENRGLYEGLNISHPLVSFENADTIINFKRFNTVKFLREDIDDIQEMKNPDGVLRNMSSSLHLLINLLWLNGVKEIKTIGITEEHKSWENTKSMLSLYGIKHERLEDEVSHKANLS